MEYFNNPFSHLLHKHPHQVCINCVMDTSDPWISFDEKGFCNHCTNYFKYKSRLGTEDQNIKKLEQLVDKLKKEGKGKDYDCIMGLSGGVDSSYLSYYAVKVLGLRPLIVHVDTGWNSELAVSNIQNIVQRLNLDLHTLVIDWEEIRDLQLAYFRSSVANLDVPQDHSFLASLYKEARRYGIKHILNGGNMQTESILPNAWGYDASDAKSLLGIHKKYGSIKLKSFPILTTFNKIIFYPFVLRMQSHRPLELIQYNKFEAKELLINELGWRDYGGKHYESRFTKFFQAYYLPAKFGYDKRKAHLASLIVSDQISRDEALQELKLPLYDFNELEEDKLFFAKKLGINFSEFQAIMKEPPKFYTDYPNNEALYDFLRKNFQALSKIYKKFK